MEAKEKKKSGGGKLSRSETVTVRLDPQLRYLVELASRKQRRTLSSFIEWALEESLNKIPVKDGYNESDLTSIADVKNFLWDVDESDRFLKLALNYPSMLNHQEQVLWKLVCENGYLWRGKYETSSPYEWDWRISETTIIHERLREYWEIFNQVANGEKDRNALPGWPKTNPKPNIDDDIPF